MKTEHLGIVDQRRIVILVSSIKAKLKMYGEQELHLVGDQVQIEVKDFGHLGIEVNGMYQSGNLAVDFYEYVNGVWRTCWRFIYPVGSRESLESAIEHNIDLLLCKKHKDELNQKRRKYRKGEPIKTLDELVNEEFVYLNDKITHWGWFMSWQLKMTLDMIARGAICYAIRKEDDEDE